MKLVIYTVITGKYDELRQPICIDDRFTYLCFSNEYEDGKIGVWEIRKIPIVVTDKQRLSRYPKIKPHELLDEFDYSVYMDANLVIAEKEFYENIFLLIKQNQILAGVKNGWRDCLYEEGFRCILSRLDTPSKIISEMRYIKSEGFPSKYGMYEANVIFRKHNNEKIINQCNMWWDMVQSFARRDQLCFSYTLWKFKLPWCYIFPDGSNTHNNSNVIFYEHPHRIVNSKRLSFRKFLKFLKPILNIAYKAVISVNVRKK
jgi:hypothetical protein